MLDNRHAQTGACDLARCGVALTREGVEQLWQIFLAHANAVINKIRSDAGIALPAARKLLAAHLNPAALRCILKRIANKIAENLFDFRAVAHQMLLPDIDIKHKGDILLFRFNLKNALNLVKKMLSINIIFIQLHLTAFNTRHIQHIIDNQQQQIARLLHLLLIIKQLRLCQPLLDQLAVAKQRIHRCTDIMRHIEQKVGLGHISLTRRLHSLLQPFVQLLRLRLCHSRAHHQHHNSCNYKQNRNSKHHMRPDKVHHGNLFRRTVIHCPSTRQHGRWHLFQRFVQDRQQNRVLPAYGEDRLRSLRQKHAVQPSVIAKLRQLHRISNHAGCLIISYCLCHIL